MTRLAPALLAVLTLAPAVALARPDSPRPETDRAGPYTLTLVDAAGTPLPTFEARGRVYVLGAAGRRYALRFHNGSSRRVEVVASVDGRDVIDGEPSALAKRGYVVDPHDDVIVDGFRVSGEAVAAFRFSSVARSYAARMGDARDVGVVGLAVFAERLPPPPPPRRWWSAEREEAGRGAAAPPAAGSAAPEAQARSEKASPGAPERPGLGTEFGEERHSPTVEVSFVRAASRPEAVLTLRYDDRRGLVALGVDVDRRRAREAALREDADPFRRDPGYARPPPGWEG